MSNFYSSRKPKNIRQHNQKMVLSLLQLVSELEDTFDIQVTPTELIPANFNSAKAIWAMVQRLQQEG